MKMVDVLKKTFALGLGACALCVEELKRLADEMVSRGETTTEEARKFVDEMTKRAEEEKSAIQNWMREQASKILEQAGAAHEARVEELERRIATLEEKLGVMRSEEKCEASAEGEN
jgi:polyhydroxyalkanoate synthesis regulator phasin